MGATSEETASQCVGRFCVDVPASTRRWAERYEMQYVRIEEIAFDPSLDRALERTFAGRLAKIEALKLERRTPTDPRGTVLERRTVEPGSFETAVYQKYNNELAVTVGGLVQTGQSGVWMEGEGDRKFIKDIGRSVQEIGLGYRPRHKDEPWPAPAKDWFHLGRGAIALPFKQSEEAEAGFQGHPLGVKLKLTTKTTDEPQKKGLVRRFSEAVMAAGPTFAGSLSPVKHRDRKVAGFAGEEMIMRDVEGKKLYFMWDFPGEANSGKRPRITLQMETRDERFDEKVALWDRLVDSLRPVSP